MKFNYEGFKQGGSVSRGSIEASTKELAIESLRSQGIYLQQIVPDTEIMREVLSSPTNPEEPAFLNTAKDLQGSASGVSAFVDDLFVGGTSAQPLAGKVGGKVPSSRQDVTVFPATEGLRNTQSKRQSNDAPWVKALESDLEDVAVVVAEMANILPLSSKDIMTQIGDKLLYDVACQALSGLKRSKLSHFCSEAKQSFTPEQEKEIRENLSRLEPKQEAKKKRAKKSFGEPKGPDLSGPGPNDPIDPNAPVHNPN